MIGARRAMAVTGRLTTGVASLVGGVWVLANTAVYRQAEAWSTAKVVDAAVGQGTVLERGSSTFFVGMDTGHGVGLRIDQLCSTGAVTGLMLVITGLLLLRAGLRPGRALLGLAAMIGLIAAVNMARLTALSWSVTRWGLAGWFEWLHLYGGAAISMAAIAVGCGLYLRLIRRSSLRLA